MKPVRRVLIFRGLGLSSPAEALLNQEIAARLQNSPFQIELYTENLQENVFPGASEQQEIRNSILQRYRDRKLDLIVALGKNPLDFIVDVHERAFKDVPVVVGGGLVGQDDSVKLDSHYTGTWESYEPDRTLEAALRLQPGTRHVVVVGGMSDFDLGLEERFHERLRSYESPLDIKYLVELPMPKLLDDLGQLPPNTVVLLTHIGLDAAGTKFMGASQADPLVVKASNAPVFGPSDVDLEHGEVGGYLNSFALEGKNIGEMATRVLNGESPRDIPVVKGTNAYIFDWRALRRWGLKESNLPPGSIVLNRQPTIWEAYKWYVVGATSLLLLETLLILSLLWQRHRRRKAEAELAFTYDGLCLAVEAGSAVGWDWDVKNGRDRWFGDLQTMFGMPSDTYSGDASEFRRRVHPEDGEFVWKAIDVARRDRKAFVAEFRVIRIDGAIRWITAAGKFYYGRDGEAERMLGMAVDITDRKRMEETLSGISRKLLQAQEQERSRIARELHDDVNQRLAMLSVELERVQAIRSDLPAEIRTRLQELRKQTVEMSADVQALSHELHTSKLEYLGLVAAMKSWCREFSERRSIEINFKANVSSVLPPETALSLFRILQEAVHNAAKYSGVKQVSAQITEDSDRIHLLISDSGRGFDLEAAKKGAGLGLTSMQERVRLINGTITIESRPMGGTSVHVQVPLGSGREAQQAAG